MVNPGLWTQVILELTATVTHINVFSRLKIFWLSRFSFSEHILISIREGDTETQWNIINLLELKLSIIYSMQNLSSNNG